jgi:hypothetical protein
MPHQPTCKEWYPELQAHSRGIALDGDGRDFHLSGHPYELVHWEEQKSTLSSAHRPDCGQGVIHVDVRK